MMRIILGLMVLTYSVSATEIYATFNIQADKSANLAFYSSGIVDEVYADVSSKVKKGEKLVELQNDDLEASLRIAQTALENAQISLKFAKKDYERQQLIKDLIDEETFDRYTLAYERAKVTVAEKKAKLDYAQSMLDRSVVLAPFDGVIFEKSVEVGDVVSGMMLRTIFKIQSSSKRKLVLEFDQKYHKSVKVGDVVRYTLNGDSKTYNGKISKIYPQIDSQNTKMKAEVDVKDFIVGLFGEGYIIVPDGK